MKYEIIVAEGSPDDEFYGTASGNWTNDVGVPNVFDSVAEAEDGIKQLQELGGAWAEPTYGVRVIGERDPL